MSTTQDDRQPLEFLSIQFAAEEFLSALGIAGVRFTHGQGDIYLDTDEQDSTQILKAKNALAKYLPRTFPHRKFRHARHRGYTRWHLRDQSGYSVGMRCGIEIVCTDEERASIGYGGVRGVNAA